MAFVGCGKRDLTDFRFQVLHVQFEIEASFSKEKLRIRYAITSNFLPTALEHDHCPESSSSTTLAKLKDSLMCDYNQFLRPVKDHRSVTSVKFRLLLKYFQYNDFSHMLSVDSWFNIFWNDEHLVWNPDTFEGIKSVHFIPGVDIWAPDISIYNRHDQSTDPKAISGETTCTVNYHGNVLCVPPLHFDTLCVPNLQKYPYDVQKCVVTFGSWVHQGEEINLTTLSPVVDLEGLAPNGEWEIIQVEPVYHRGNYSCCPNSTYPSVEFLFNLRRIKHSHFISSILPLIVCILITITSMAMSPLNKDRFLLACLSVMGHILHVQNLFYTMPTTGEIPPTVLTITRDSTLLAGFSIIFTVILKSLMENKAESPGWIAVTASVLIASRPGQLIFLHDNSLKGAAASQKQEDGDTIVSNNITSNSATTDWRIIAKFLDVLLFISYLLVYVILILSF
ncbi:hypothetical protein ABEB36_003156 [Hypothenemus hampei]|uniref:Neurotransmitter-gated ion-channel ligand-binding domain-containing protein n=1 Tax=Hypothenemus hampei TaxID=57062 RepID=A0ABD1F874_HYPHA